MLTLIYSAIPGTDEALTNADFEFLRYTTSYLGDLIIREPRVGDVIKSVIKCGVPAGGIPMTCGVGTSNAKGSSLSITNGRAFTFSQNVQIGVRLTLPCSCFFLAMLACLLAVT